MAYFQQWLNKTPGVPLGVPVISVSSMILNHMFSIFYSNLSLDLFPHQVAVQSSHKDRLIMAFNYRVTMYV